MYTLMNQDLKESQVQKKVKKKMKLIVILLSKNIKL